jgi:hypothetical protein
MEFPVKQIKHSLFLLGVSIRNSRDDPGVGKGGRIKTPQPLGHELCRKSPL